MENIYDEFKKELNEMIFSTDFGWMDGTEWSMDGDQATDMIYKWFTRSVNKIFESLLKELQEKNRCFSETANNIINKTINEHIKKLNEVENYYKKN